MMSSIGSVGSIVSMIFLTVLLYRSRARTDIRWIIQFWTMRRFIVLADTDTRYTIRAIFATIAIAFMRCRAVQTDSVSEASVEMNAIIITFISDRIHKASVMKYFT
jgi:hypothetical protein